MAEGEGRTLQEAFEKYAEKKSGEIFSEKGVSEKSFVDGMKEFDVFHPVEILVKTHPHNQWVKGYKVKDPGR